MPLELLGAPLWHPTKLKRGQLAGNRFKVVVTGLLDDDAAHQAGRQSVGAGGLPAAKARAEAVLAALAERGGAPNYYGTRARTKHGALCGAALRRRTLQP